MCNHLLHIPVESVTIEHPTGESVTILNYRP
uniref:Uncharacterized protein n=1 Tax=Anguilla anguilla TaxID=7936 RepID=A0A0E9RI22_ANGAN